MNTPYSKQEKIRFQHIDYAGIVFYPRFLDMLNGLVEDWFEEVLHLPFAEMHKTHGIPTVDLKVQFKKPARLGETLTKKLWVKELGSSSILCGFSFENAQGQTCLEGEVTLVHVAIAADSGNIKSETLSDAVKSKIAPYIIHN
jgi:4-hydroxybenzoyl-CoA thioesterase